MTSFEIIKSYYESFNSKNVDGMIVFLSDNVIHDINQGSRVVGKDEFSHFLKDMNNFYDETLSDISILASPNGERASAEFICKGFYKNTAPGLPNASGQKYEICVGCFFEFNGEKVVRISNYYNMKNWLDQIENNIH